jgi:hypothetical protein
MHDPQIGVGDPNQRSLTWGNVLALTYRLYAEKFWTYFRIALLPAVVASCFGYFQRTVTPQLLHSAGSLSSKLPLMFLVGWTTGAVYSIISAFFFSAIAATIVGAADDSPLADAYSLARKRLRPVIAWALLTWTLFYVGRMAAAFAVFELLDRFSLTHYWVRSLAIGAMFLMLLTLLSKFSLAIPELMQNTAISAGHAMRNSLKATEHWEVFFMFFLLKSATLGYFVYWVCNLILDQLWQHGYLSAVLDPYVTWFLNISIAAIIETPLFIAFSILYASLRAERESPAAFTGTSNQDILGTSRYHQ